MYTSLDEYGKGIQAIPDAVSAIVSMKGQGGKPIRKSAVQTAAAAAPVQNAKSDLERYHEDVMAGGQGNFKGGSIKPTFNTPQARKQSGEEIYGAKMAAIDPRARALGVDPSWGEFSSPWAQEYKDAAIYKKGNSYAGYGTQSPEAMDADQQRANAAHERTMGIYDREAKARHEMRMMQATADGNAGYAKELQGQYAAMWPKEADVQRLANRGAIDKARVEQEDPARVGMGEYYKGAGANQAAQARSAAFMQGLNERAAGGDKNAMRMLSVFNKQDQSGHLATAAGKVIESHMGTEQELMSKLKLLTSLFQQQGGATGATGTGKTVNMSALKAAGKTPTEAEAAGYTVINDMADGGVVGYAGGGAIQEPTQDPMQRVHPLVGEYRRYSMIAQQMGATPVSFEDFGALRQSAAQRQAQPQDYSEGGVVGYAEGGGVGAWMREKFMPKTTAAIRGDRIEQELNKQTGHANQQPAPPPQKEVHSSDPETEALLRKYKGFAEGGAVAVGGRQVLGPGDGKSDSIPAVIDGRKPAALSTGEFVMPVEAVQHFGLDRLNKMVESARKSRQEV